VDLGAVIRLRAIVAAVVGLTAAYPGAAQTDAGRPASIVIVTGSQATVPIPTLMEGSASNVANMEMADQLFLRLAGLGPTLMTAGDNGFVPLLARSWSRRDSVTLAFDLDPRARWQDGVPVTSRDVLFTLRRARNRDLAPQLSELLKHISGVIAEGDHRVVFTFSHPYAEQLYDATFHVAPLPAHLLDTIPPEALARSSFVTQPVGDGPYRWVRSVPGQFVELTANPDFLLGKPAIDRVIVRVAADPNARMNYLLSGEADAMDNVPPPLSNLERIAGVPWLRLIPVPSPTLGYILFNQRDPRSKDRPHPILSDIRVRRAILLSLDRPLLVRAVFGSYGEVPFGPASPILWIRHGAPKPERQNLPEARRLLRLAGWRDSNRDGILDRQGVPLGFTLSLPNTSAIRKQLAALLQEQLRAVGIHLELQQYEFPVWNERRNAGEFDIDFSASSQDPTPSGLTQSWSCTGGSNVGKYCDPQVDSLMLRAILGRGDTKQLWHEVLRRIEADLPAVFLYAPTYVYAVHRRFRNVSLSPTSSWTLLRDWTVGPETATRGR
jgi:peptide/nickel transport system substrate-binding protein